MGLKKPEQFVVGDIIKNVPGTPYSGSAITAVRPYGPAQTQAEFKNGEIVEFFNGYDHEMTE